MNKASQKDTCKNAVKGKSIEDIVRKAKFLRNNWSVLRSKLTLPELDVEYLYENEYAPLIGTICDEKVKSEDAWRFPEWLKNKIGDLTPQKIIELGTSGLRELLKEYFTGKWPWWMKSDARTEYLDNVSDYIVKAIEYFKQRNITPITMFEDREYEATEMYFVLRSISGIGPKKALMIARDFLYASKGIIRRHPWYDQVKKRRPNFKVNGYVTPPIDVHVVKVFCRLFGASSGRWDKAKGDPELVQDIIMFSILAFPDLPAKIDEILWNVGRLYCKKKPKCRECILNVICDYAAGGSL